MTVLYGGVEKIIHDTQILKVSPSLASLKIGCTHLMDFIGSDLEMFWMNAR